MKIAVCLSGQPRKFELGYEALSKSLEGNEVDYFMHHWFDAGSVGRPHKIYSDTQSRTAGVVEKDTDKKIADLYQPKKIILEKQIEFEVNDNFLQNHGRPSKTRQPPEIYASMLYSRWRAGELLSQHIKENNKNYDLVIWTRTDVAPLSAITEEIVEPSNYHTAYEGPEWNKYHMNTSLHVSDTTGILHFLNLYNHYKDVYDSGIDFCDHRISFAHVNKLQRPFKEIFSPPAGGDRKWRWIREEGLSNF